MGAPVAAVLPVELGTAITPLQVPSLLDNPVRAGAWLVGLAFLSGVLAGTLALIFRWYAQERIQRGLAVLVGLSGVAISLNTTTALGRVIGERAGPLSPETALFNIAAFAVGTFAATGAVRVGDSLGSNLFAATGGRDLEGEVSRVVEAVGRVISVELPEEIDDIVGYDPVSDETKTQIAGRTFLFPRRLTVSELESRIVTRLRDDYGVGTVDIELVADGTVEYLGLGARAAGIGPTLPPETAAVAVRADPAFAASAGDVVQVRDPASGDRVTTAEIRGVAGDVVTLAVDAAETDTLRGDTEYRLVTLPVEPRHDREFVSLLRASEETMASSVIEAGSPLAGQPVGSIDVTVVAVCPAGGGVETLPKRDRQLAVGDELYALGRPDALRKLEAATASETAAILDPIESSTDDD